MFAALGLAACVVVIDQVTKVFIRAALDLHEAVVLTPFLSIVHVENRGAAFGMFSRFGNTFFIAVTSVAIVVLLVLVIRAGRERFPLALLLGGAVGNVIDRLLYGSVTDFVDVHLAGHHWPAFNVADSALTVGIIVMIAMELRHMRESREETP